MPAIKSANVELVGYELTKGSGLVTIKLTGEVGAMNAAVSAGLPPLAGSGRSTPGKSLRVPQPGLIA